MIDLTDYLFLPGRQGGQTVQGLQADTSPIVTLNAAAAGTTLQRWSLTGTPSMDLKTVVNGSANDYLLTTTAVGAGLQIQFNNTGSGLRLTNQAALSGLVRGFVEAGPTSENLALTGFNGATGTSLHSLFTYASFNTWDGSALTNAIRVGINTDPYDYRSSAAASQPGALLVARRTGATAGVPTSAVEGDSASTEMAFAISQASSALGGAPSRTIGATVAGFRHTGHLALFNSTTVAGLVDAQNIGSTETLLRLRRASNSENYLAIGRVAAWSDTLNALDSCYSLLGPTSTNSHRAWFLASNGGGDGFSVFTRFGLSSAYTLISNAAAGNTAGFLAPEATPTVLRVVNAATGGADASVLLKLQSNRAGQSGDFLECINSTPSTLMKVDSTGKLTAVGGAYLGAAGAPAAESITIGTTISGFGGGLYLDDGSGFTGQILLAANLTANRTWQLPDGSGTIVVGGIKSVLTGGTGSAFDSSTASNGASFADFTTSTKRLRFVLSGAVGNNSITLTNTALRNYGLGNLGGNITIVGDQTTAVSAGRMEKVDLTAQAAAIGATNLTNSPPAGCYVVHYAILDTTADVTAGTIQFQINYTDDVGATTQTGAALVLTATGRDRGTFEVQLASGNISYQTNLTGIIATAKYSLYVRVEFLG